MPDPVVPRKTRPTTVTLTNEQHADLRLMAERRLSSVSQVVRTLVQEGVERERDERDDGR